ncbi:MAG: class I SAM-dependent methyltransferase [Polyangiaceae bacterium]
MTRVEPAVAALNDRLAIEHPIDAYYASSPLPIRWIEARRLGILRAFIGDAAGLDLLDIGAGGGHVLAMFPKARRVALDVSNRYLEQARARLGDEVTYVHAEIDRADFPPKSFDRIVCTEVLEHTEDPERILAAIARLLRPTGVAAITVPNDPLIDRLKSAARRAPLSSLIMGPASGEYGGAHYHLHRWTPAEMQALLTRRFKVLEARHAPFDALPVRACYRCAPK